MKNETIAEWDVIGLTPYKIRIVESESFPGSFIAQGKRPEADKWLHWKTLKGGRPGKEYLESFDDYLRGGFSDVERTK